ncbi:MAG: deoxyribodipyrimidine photolyase, partial [Polyangiales bacterium]
MKSVSTPTPRWPYPPAMPAVPNTRLRPLNDRPVRPDGAYVLYWMVAQRRVQWNFALDHAIRLCHQLGRPLLLFEALRVGYPWASARLHAFVLEGMRDHAAALAGQPVHYYPYVEPEPGAGKGLLAALAADACAVVSDDFPCFFLPRMQRAAAARLPVRVDLVDSAGLLPLSEAAQAFHRAYDFRRFVQRHIAPHLTVLPDATPWQPGGAGAALSPPAPVPPHVTERWPAAQPAALAAPRQWLSALPIDQSVAVAADIGGSVAATAQLRRFLRTGLTRYAAERNHPDEDVASGLSPWLHFGHISAHQIFAELSDWLDWRPDRLGGQRGGGREGFWQMGEGGDGFMEELVTWRELGYHSARWDPDFDRYAGLPAWAQQTLAAHQRDPRPARYGLDVLEAGQSGDTLWNAAQRQLVRDGRMHNYLRMLWGKRVLEWTEEPAEAFAHLVHLNNKYALDGRNPNSYSGIGWVFGRYDRAWGPERPIFGKVRYMSSE